MTSNSHILNKRLSIRCFADGFSFYVHRGDGTVQRLVQRTQMNENQIADEVIKEITIAFPNLRPQIQLVIHSTATRLVPNQLFKEENAEAFLNLFLESKKIVKPQIETDFLGKYACVNVYYTFRWVKMLAERLVAEQWDFTQMHDISELIKSANETPTEESLHAPFVTTFVSEDEISLVAFRHNKLLLANKFAYTTVEDAVYHVLNCCKQLDFQPEITQLRMNSDQEVDAIKSALSNYINI